MIGSSATIEVPGFRNAISKYPDIKSLPKQLQRADGTKSWNYLTLPKGSIDIVPTVEMGLGALQAIKAAGRTELIRRLVTMDGQRAAIKTVVDGEHLAISIASLWKLLSRRLWITWQASRTQCRCSSQSV